MKETQRETVANGLLVFLFLTTTIFSTACAKRDSPDNDSASVVTEVAVETSTRHIHSPSGKRIQIDAEGYLKPTVDTLPENWKEVVHERFLRILSTDTDPLVQWFYEELAAGRALYGNISPESITPESYIIAAVKPVEQGSLVPLMRLNPYVWANPDADESVLRYCLSHEVKHAEQTVNGYHYATFFSNDESFFTPLAASWLFEMESEGWLAGCERGLKDGIELLDDVCVAYRDGGLSKLREEVAETYFCSDFASRGGVSVRELYLQYCDLIREQAKMPPDFRKDGA